jgi:hypothetical protein
MAPRRLKRADAAFIGCYIRRHVPVAQPDRAAVS